MRYARYKAPAASPIALPGPAVQMAAEMFARAMLTGTVSIRPKVAGLIATTTTRPHTQELLTRTAMERMKTVMESTVWTMMATAMQLARIAMMASR